MQLVKFKDKFFIRKPGFWSKWKYLFFVHEDFDVYYAAWTSDSTRAASMSEESARENFKRLAPFKPFIGDDVEVIEEVSE